MAPATKKSAPDSQIPVEVRIGIAGKWNPDQRKAVTKGVLAARLDLAAALKHCKHVTYPPVTGLASESADLMKNPDESYPAPDLSGETWLPRFAQRYWESFKTSGSKRKFRAQFESLAASADPSNAARQAAEKAIQNCSVLIAIWHPVQGFGDDSAAPLIAFALRTGRTIYWVDPSNGHIRRYDNEDGFLDSILSADAYNGVQLDKQDIAAAEQAVREQLALHAFDAHIHPRAFGPLLENVLPQMARAELLAARMRHRYVMSGLAIYVLTTFAIAVGAVVSFFSLRPAWGLLEVFAMVGSIAVVWFTEINNTLQRWIDYRFLAERLRATAYLFVAGVSCESPGAVRPSHWTLQVLHWICGPQQPPLPDPNHLEAVKQFTLDGWVRAQRMWFQKRSQELKWNHAASMWLGSLLFLAAGAFAVFHATGKFASHEVVWEAFTIIAAATCLSVAGYRGFRVFRPISLEYAQMAEQLGQTAEDIENAHDVKTLTEVLTRAFDAFNFEHQNWRVLVHVHEPSESL
jgi:SMODS and SLOG-associating 2TM effector domain 1